MSERRTLREMAEEAAGNDPWACPHCGCRGPHRVANSYEAGGQRRRRRICRHCGQGLIKTAEVPVPEGCVVRVVPVEDDVIDVA